MILPRYTLERIYLPTSTPGSLFPGSVRIESEIIAKTLELAWRNNAISSDPKLASCIPEGIYLVAQEPPKPSRNYPYFRIVHVPGRHWYPEIKMSSVLWHRGSKVEDLLGCIIPGSRHGDYDNDGVPNIEESSKKLAWMVINMPKYWELEIRKKA